MDYQAKRSTGPIPEEPPGPPYVEPKPMPDDPPGPPDVEDPPEEDGTDSKP